MTGNVGQAFLVRDAFSTLWANRSLLDYRAGAQGRHLMLRNLLVIAVLAWAALTVFWLAELVRAALSPNEPYAAHIGLSLDQCVSAQPVLTDDQARGFCVRPVPKSQ